MKKIVSISPSIDDNCPILRYKSYCTIFNEGNPLSITPCGHIFDADSLERWLNESEDCPIDRSKLSPESLYTIYKDKNGGIQLETPDSDLESPKDRQIFYPGELRDLPTSREIMRFFKQLALIITLPLVSFNYIQLNTSIGRQPRREEANIFTLFSLGITFLITLFVFIDKSNETRVKWLRRLLMMDGEAIRADEFETKRRKYTAVVDLLFRNNVLDKNGIVRVEWDKENINSLLESKTEALNITPRELNDLINAIEAARPLTEALNDTEISRLKMNHILDQHNRVCGVATFRVLSTLFPLYSDKQCLDLLKQLLGKVSSGAIKRSTNKVIEAKLADTLKKHDEYKNYIATVETSDGKQINILLRLPENKEAFKAFINHSSKQYKIAVDFTAKLRKELKQG